VCAKEREKLGKTIGGSASVRGCPEKKKKKGGGTLDSDNWRARGKRNTIRGKRKKTQSVVRLCPKREGKGKKISPTGTEKRRKHRKGPSPCAPKRRKKGGNDDPGGELRRGEEKKVGTQKKGGKEKEMKALLYYL